jgi:uncharacterized RDD family membrane protein YckC
MKCERCGNEYNSQYYFATPTICNDCFSKMSAEEQKAYYDEAARSAAFNEGYANRIGFGKSLLAALIDYAIVAIVTIIIFSYSGFFKSAADFGTNVRSAGGDVALIQELQNEFLAQNRGNFYFSILISMAYFSLEILVAASLGKLILGLQIGRADGKKAGYGSLILRYILKYSVNIFSLLWLMTGISTFNSIGTLVFLVIFVGFFFTLSNKRQAFHDMIAKTAVYKKNAIIEEEEALA